MTDWHDMAREMRRNGSTVPEICDAVHKTERYVRRAVKGIPFAKRQTRTSNNVINIHCKKAGRAPRKTASRAKPFDWFASSVSPEKRMLHLRKLVNQDQVVRVRPTITLPRVSILEKEAA
jgi:hypothetical protein